MSDWPAVIAVIPGIFSGMLGLSLIIHWVGLLLSALGRSPEESGVPEKAQRNWMILYSVVHPVPWLLLVGVPYGVYRIATDPPPAGWLWFFGSATATIIVVFVTSVLAARKDD